MANKPQAPAGERLRALGVIRLSRLTDASTSPERQRDVIQRWCDQHGATLVGEAVDLDVSGAVDPFERDGLGPWLTDSPEKDYAVLVAWKLDRVSRSALDTLRLLEWLDARGKRLVTVSDGIDTSTSMGRLFVQIAGVFAELERSTIRERVNASRQALRKAGRWAGSGVPYGYMPVPLDGGGYVLNVDEPAAGVIRWMAEQILGGDSVSEVVRKLNAAGHLAPRDRQRELRGQPLKGDKWSDSTVWNLLTNPSLLGWSVHNGDIDHEAPKAAPALSPSVYERVQETLNSRRKAQTRNPGAASAPLSGVALCYAVTEHLTDCPGEGSTLCKCPRCLHPLWHRSQHVPSGRGRQKNAKTYRYYYCKHKGHTRQIPAEDLEAIVLHTFEKENGQKEVFEPVYRPPTDTSEERAAVKFAVDDLTDRLATTRSSGVRAALTAQLHALDDKLADLESTPDDPGGTEMVPTGRTWLEEIRRLDVVERRKLWLRTGYRFWVWWPPNLQDFGFGVIPPGDWDPQAETAGNPGPRWPRTPGEPRQS